MLKSIKTQKKEYQEKNMIYVKDNINKKMMQRKEEKGDEHPSWGFMEGRENEE